MSKRGDINKPDSTKTAIPPSLPPTGEKVNSPKDEKKTDSLKNDVAKLESTKRDNPKTINRSSKTLKPVKTATEVDPSSSILDKSEKSSRTSDKAPEKRENAGEELKKILNFIWAKLILFILWLVEFSQMVYEYVADFCFKIYCIILFCYRKPEVAKDLFYTTCHLLKVSYDAEIWTWSEVLSVLKSHLIQPMTRAQTRAQPTAPKTEKKKVK